MGELGERVGRCSRSNGPNSTEQPQTVDRQFLTNKVAQLESKWGSEVKALKQDLHRTILAHNHNSDLMRHHRDALDQARRDMDSQIPNKPEQESQYDKLERMLRSGQAKQRALEALTERLSTLEQQVTDFLPWLPSSHAGAGGSIPSGFNAASQQRIENPQQLGGKKKKEGDVPTEEDIRQKFLQGAAKPDAAHNFNLEAPVFVPRGAPPVADAAPANEDDVEVEEAEVGSEEADAVEEEPVAPATATPAVPVEPAVAEAVEDPSVAVASAPGLAEAVPAPDPVEPTPVSD